MKENANKGLNFIEWINKPKKLKSDLMAISFKRFDNINDAVFSPDDKYICSGVSGNTGGDAHLFVFDAKTGNNYNKWSGVLF